MLPSEEEKTKILDAQMANPDVPLGKAEQFLLTLASISELEARLKLWLFMIDYANQERVSSTQLQFDQMSFNTGFFYPSRWSLKH